MKVECQAWGTLRADRSRGALEGRFQKKSVRPLVMISSKQNKTPRVDMIKENSERKKMQF